MCKLLKFLNAVYDANDENLVIGTMVVTVELIDCMNAIKRQLHVGASETFE